MLQQYLAPFWAVKRVYDAKLPQRRRVQQGGYLSGSSCDNLAAGYRTVTVLPIRRPGANLSARGLRHFDRRPRCPRASKSFFPLASLLLLPHARSRRKRLYTSIPSRSQSSPCTPASTSNIFAGRTFVSAPEPPTPRRTSFDAGANTIEFYDSAFYSTACAARREANT